MLNFILQETIQVLDTAPTLWYNTEHNFYKSQRKEEIR